MIVEVEYDGQVKRVQIDPGLFFADPNPDEIVLFEQAIGAERFAELQAGIVALASAGKATLEQLAPYSAPDVIAAIVNVRLRRPVDAPVGYRNTDGENADMRKVSIG